MNRFPPRPRTPSGHDIPIPESVFHAVAAVHADQAATRAEVAGLRADVGEVKGAVADLAKVIEERNASWKDKAVTQLGALGLAVLSAVVGVRVTTPTPEPQRIEVHHTPVDPRMAECAPHKPGTVAQSECFARVQAEIQSGKRPTP